MYVQICKNAENFKQALFSKHLLDSGRNNYFVLKFVGVSDPEKNCVLVVKFVCIGFVSLRWFFVVFVKSLQERSDSVLIIFVQLLGH